MNSAGLEETTCSPVGADSSVTEVETSGLKSVVSDLLVRGLVMSFTYVEALLLVELRTSEDVTCLVVRWVFTVSRLDVMVKTVLESPSGFSVDE